jgi:hypothetical protein
MDIMKQTLSKIFILIFSLTASIITSAQEVIERYPADYDPHYNKVIPDKVLEIGLPLLVLFLVVNSIVSIFKVRAENRLKEKALDKDLGEATLVAMFADDKALAKYTYLKWFLILTALGISFVLLHFIVQYSKPSGYLVMGIITFFLALAFLIYYRVISKK